MRARRNTAPAPPANGSAGFSSSGFLFSGELAVAVERAREVAAHGVARGLGVAGGDGIGDAAVLFLDQREIGALAAHALGQAADGAPRDEMAADELQEAREFRIAGGFGDGAMEREIFVDRGFTF